jgi:hypothetical protein
MVANASGESGVSCRAAVQAYRNHVFQVLSAHFGTDRVQTRLLSFIPAFTQDQNQAAKRPSPDGYFPKDNSYQFFEVAFAPLQPVFDRLQWRLEQERRQRICVIQPGIQ